MAGKKRVLGTFLALCLAYYWSLRSRGGRPLIAPPYCAWRFIGNFDAWNVALPDASSVYHVLVIYINEGDVLRINGSYPYCRYFSFQTYGVPDFLPRASLRDFEIVPREGVNLYSNTSAAVKGMPQGQYTMHITAHGDENRTNELGALSMQSKSGWSVLFLRIYELERSLDVDAPPYHPDADLSCFAPGGAYEKENPAEWGWACPPVVEVRRKGWANGEFQTIPMCKYRRKRGFKGYNDVAKPVVICRDWGYNKEDNFALPSKKYLSGKFSNKDARYLFSCGLATPNVTKGDQHEYWARVQGILPRTPGSLYQAPLVANHSEYDVRYVSVSSVSGSLPYRTYATLNDQQISRFYEKELGADWDRTFVIWVGPNDAQMPAQARKEKAMFLPRGKSFKGKDIPYPALLYRQILAKSQVTRSYFLNPPSNTEHASDSGEAYARYAIAEVLPEVCTRAGYLNTSTSTSQGSCDAQSQEDHEQELKFKTVCCGSEAPEWCHDPPLMKHRMREHYPKVQYYLRRTGTEELVPAEPLWTNA